MSKIVPIVFCADANYGLYLPVAIQSIIEHSSPKCSYHIIVLDCGIGAAAINAIRAQISAHGNFSLSVGKIDSWLESHSASFKEEWYFTKAIYGRLAIPELCGEYDRIIYADIDMIFRRDIAELMALDLADNYIAAVSDTLLEAERALGVQKTYCENLGLTADDRYINSGFIVFNSALWRRENIFEKIINFLRSRKLLLPDQDALNSVCRGRILYLPPQWNCLSSFYIGRRIAKNQDRKNTEFNAVIAEWQAAHDSGAAVIHYIGQVKPWARCASAEYDIWWSYAVKTPLYPRYLCGLASHSAAAGQAGDSAEYRFLGLPYWGVKAGARQKVYLLANKFRIAKKRTGPGNSYLYILGLKLFSVRRKKAG